MKIRNGFVSNSSSSSFIVNANSTMEVFNKIISIVQNEYEDYPDGKKLWKKYHYDGVMRFKESHDEDFNGGIIIPFTCNYDTFIFPSKDGKCLVETCHNHDWSDLPIYKYVENRFEHYENDDIFVIVSTNRVTTPKKYSHGDKYV